MSKIADSVTMKIAADVLMGIDRALAANDLGGAVRMLMIARDLLENLEAKRKAKCG